MNRAGFAVVAVAVLALLWAVDPATTRLLPACPLYATTGLYCSGCGATRALHALLHGEIGAAFRFNPLLVAALPLLVPAAASEVRRMVSGRGWSVGRLPNAAFLGIATIVVAYGILRNVPGFEALGPPR